MFQRIRHAVPTILRELAVLPISMSAYAVIFTVSYRVFVSNDLLAGWHYAWSNPVALAAFTVVASALRELNSAAVVRVNRRRELNSVALTA